MFGRELLVASINFFPKLKNGQGRFPIPKPISAKHIKRYLRLDVLNYRVEILRYWYHTLWYLYVFSTARNWNGNHGKWGKKISVAEPFSIPPEGRLERVNFPNTWHFTGAWACLTGKTMSSCMQQVKLSLWNCLRTGFVPEEIRYFPGNWLTLFPRYTSFWGFQRCACGR